MTVDTFEYSTENSFFITPSPSAEIDKSFINTEFCWNHWLLGLDIRYFIAIFTLSKVSNNYNVSCIFE